jgi:hypothetical protein
MTSPSEGSSWGSYGFNPLARSAPFGGHVKQTERRAASPRGHSSASWRNVTAAGRSTGPGSNAVPGQLKIGQHGGWTPVAALESSRSSTPTPLVDAATAGMPRHLTLHRARVTGVSRWARLRGSRRNRGIVAGSQPPLHRRSAAGATLRDLAYPCTDLGHDGQN